MNNDLIIIECPMDFANPTRLIVNYAGDVSELDITNTDDEEFDSHDVTFQYFHEDGHIEINGIRLSPRQHKYLLEFLTTGSTY